MIENFTKALGKLKINCNDMSYEECDKFIYKFNVENIQKHWLCFYAFYKTGYTDACNKIGVLAVQEIGKNG